MVADPQILVGGTPYTGELLFDHGSGGHSEGFGFWVGDGVQAPVTALLDVMRSIAKERRKVLCANSKILAIRVSRDDRQGDSSRVSGEKYECGPGKVEGNSGPWDQGIQLVVTDVTNQVRSYKPMGGFAIADLNLGTDVGRSRPVTSVKATAYAAFLNQKLTSNLAGENNGDITACIAAMEKGDDVNPIYRISKWEQDPQGFLQLTLKDGAPEWVMGDRVHLSHKRKKGLAGVCGYYHVVENSVVGGKTVITLDTKTCYPMAMFVDLIATLQLRPTAYYAVDAVDLGNYCERPIGRPFFLQRGRRSTRGC